MNPRSVKIPKEIMRKFSYGLFLLTARADGRDNGCIVDAVQQVTTSPARITVTLRKTTHTHAMVRRTGLLNLCILARNCPFPLFVRFGFQSGRTTDKFADFSGIKRSANGLTYLDDHACAYLSGRVVSTLDLGTYTLFLAEITEAGSLSDAAPLTYDYYLTSIKK